MAIVRTPSTSTTRSALAPILPYGIYTIPEVSMAGETEESLQQKGVAYVVGRAAYATTPAGRSSATATGS